MITTLIPYKLALTLIGLLLIICILEFVGLVVQATTIEVLTKELNITRRKMNRFIRRNS